MQTKTLIIGGGLAGLQLASQLQAAGQDYHLVEARSRLGGRIKPLSHAGAAIDLGPSWVWPGQTRVAQRIADLGLHVFAQWSEGAQLFEHPSGEVARDKGFMSMAGSYRIAGGSSALTDAIAQGLDPAKITLNTPVTGLTDRPEAILADGRRIAAERIVLAVPPRLAAALNVTPALSVKPMLERIPTWMGAHAKFVAVYDKPFWREAGLSGDASSRRGPMVEIHDASPADGSLGALFGFVGLPAAVRADTRETLVPACLAQLQNLFGADAAQPHVHRLEDWSRAPFTSTAADATPPPGHPSYLMPAQARNVWDGKLIFATTEMAPDNGGLIEGALAAADAAAAQIIGA
ncbi:MAG: FAD-dependent oxidoreductase [Pseudomonadota bacterium]